MPKHPETTLTREQLVQATPEQHEYDFRTFYDVPISLMHDELHDAEHFIALGHHEPKRFLAAMLAYTRKHTELDVSDYQLDDFGATRDYDARRWHTFYRHADAITVDEPDEHTEDWCVCDDYTWQSVQMAGPGDGTIPTMIWRVD